MCIHTSSKNARAGQGSFREAIKAEMTREKSIFTQKTQVNEDIKQDGDTHTHTHILILLHKMQRFVLEVCVVVERGRALRTAL